MRMRVCACINCSSSPNKDACVCACINCSTTQHWQLQPLTCSLVDWPEICTQKKIWCFFRLQNRLSGVTFGLFRNPAWDFPLLVFGLGRQDPACMQLTCRSGSGISGMIDPFHCAWHCHAVAPQEWHIVKLLSFRISNTIFLLCNECIPSSNLQTGVLSFFFFFAHHLPRCLFSVCFFLPLFVCFFLPYFLLSFCAFCI